MRVVVEAGTHSPWVDRVLKKCGYEAIVANSRKLRMIYESGGKGDPKDEEMLARVGQMDPGLLCPIISERSRRPLGLPILLPVAVGEAATPLPAADGRGVGEGGARHRRGNLAESPAPAYRGESRIKGGRYPSIPENARYASKNGMSNTASRGKVRFRVMTELP
jgi:hypothetical protein